jgi:hypothetical protein
MAKNKISEYSATPADNTDISNINIAEGCSPANVNNAIRSLMAQIKDLQAGTSGDTIPLTAGGTGSTTAGTARTALGAASSGANSDITSLTGLTTALSAAQGGTGLTTFTAGTTYVAPTIATTFTAKQTFTGSSSVLSSKISNSAEVVTVAATAATGTINYDVTTQSVIYYTSNASANWTVNFRASSGTSLNTAMATGESVSVVFAVTQGTTAYYNNAVTIDGTSVTPKWQGGSAPSLGNVSSVDVYTYTIIKTASATYTVLASVTKFA